MKQVTATAIGFLAASVIPPLYFAIFTPLTGVLSLAGALGTFRVMYPFSLLAIFLFGGPAYLALSYFKIIKWWSTVLVGFGLGVIVAVVIRLPNAVDFRNSFALAVIAALSAFTFWTVWRLGGEKSTPD